MLLHESQRKKEKQYPDITENCKNAAKTLQKRIMFLIMIIMIANLIDTK